MIAYCGLDCSVCPAYIATRANDDAKRAECARQWSAQYKSDIKAESINCSGCKAEGIRFNFCNVCAVRTCGSKKGVENCAVCADYGCQNLQMMWNMSPDLKNALEALRKKQGSP